MLLLLGGPGGPQCVGRSHSCAHGVRAQARECELKVLDIGNNSMTGDGVAAVAKLLLAKPTLRELNLYMNDLGDTGVSRVRARVGNHAMHGLRVC